MKKTLALLLLVTIFATAQTNPNVPNLSPAELSIAAAQKQIEKKPTQCAGYNQLAMALARRARKTSDIKFYAQAEEALRKSIKLAPGNHDGEKVHVWLLLGRHEFAADLDAMASIVG